MSIHTELLCDARGKQANCHVRLLINRQEHNTVEGATALVHALNDVAKVNGWSIENGEAICPACAGLPGFKT